MHSRELDGTDGGGTPCGDGRGAFGDLVFRTPPNWTAVGFFGLVGGLHLCFAILAFSAGRWEGYLSLILGCVFLVVSCVCTQFRYELAVFPARRRIRLRHGAGRFSLERFVPFSAVRGVRLTLLGGARPARRVESRIELLSLHDDIECPPTRIPRQEALCLAMALDVPLTKVSDERAAEAEVVPVESRHFQKPPAPRQPV